MKEHSAEIRGNLAHCADIAPVLQFSEVVVEPSDRRSQGTAALT